MLQVARLAQRTLGDAAELIVKYIKSLSTPEGGYANRGGQPDLYYTPFALDCLVALTTSPNDEINLKKTNMTREWLQAFGDGASLDFVHRCCLARAWASQPTATLDKTVRASLVKRIESTRSKDGGFAAVSGAKEGTAYGCFLAINAFADLQQPPLSSDDRKGIANCLESLRTQDGGWANAVGQQRGSTTASAAAIATLASLELGVPKKSAEFLLAQQHSSGGFVAAPEVPMPDLLSTAVALHALDTLEHEWRDSQELVLDFLDSLWSAEGAFHGSWADDEPDVEYTFYGLVALGHASV